MQHDRKAIALQTILQLASCLDSAEDAQQRCFDHLERCEMDVHKFEYAVSQLRHARAALERANARLVKLSRLASGVPLDQLDSENPLINWETILE
jgi:hypothetical protein